MRTTISACYRSIQGLGSSLRRRLRAQPIRRAALAAVDLSVVVASALRRTATRMADSQGKTVENPEALLETVAKNRLVDELRRQHRQADTLSIHDVPSDPESSQPSPETRMDIEEFQATLEQLLSHLPDAERAVVQAYYVDGKRTPAIAQELGIHPGSAARILARAVQRLRTRAGQSNDESLRQRR